jgi:hypothetical protein
MKSKLNKGQTPNYLGTKSIFMNPGHETSHDFEAQCSHAISTEYKLIIEIFGQIEGHRTVHENL